MFSIIKGQLNSLNAVLLLVIIACLFLWMKRGKVARLLFLISVVFFILISTDYLPRYFVRKLERAYPAVRGCVSFTDNKPIVIHVLGGGYTADDQLAALSQLSQESKGRLIEAIRLWRCVPHAMIVCSGNKVSGNLSMAETYREAAISLGADSLKIVTLSDPVTTQDEAEEVTARFGNEINLVVVTSALHMQRAVMNYNLLGMEPLPAPTNYLVKDKASASHIRWWPSVDNIRMMDAVIHEYLGTLKGMFNQKE